MGLEPKDMADAIDLARFYLSEASRLSSAALVSIQIDRAETLRKWLLETFTEDEVMPRDVVNAGPNALRDTDKVKEALRILGEHGWLVRLEAGTVVRGRSRKEAWRIVRGL